MKSLSLLCILAWTTMVYSGWHLKQESNMNNDTSTSTEPSITNQDSNMNATTSTESSSIWFKSLVELMITQKSETDKKIAFLEQTINKTMNHVVELQKLTGVSDPVEECSLPKTVPRSLIECSASSSYSSSYSCEKALIQDSSYWCTREGGVGSWIELYFKTPVFVKEIKLIGNPYARDNLHYANIRQVQILIDGKYVQSVPTEVAYPGWNYIHLLHGKFTNTLRISMKQVYDHKDAGLSVIQVLGCF